MEWEKLVGVVFNVALPMGILVERFIFFIRGMISLALAIFHIEEGKRDYLQDG